MFRTLAGRLGPAAREEALHLAPLNGRRQPSRVSETTLVCGVKGCFPYPSLQGRSSELRGTARKAVHQPKIVLQSGKVAPGLFSSHQESYVSFADFV